MASNYPTSLDSFTNPTSNDSLNSPSHALQHANANDAIEAIEAKLGIGASTAGSATSGYVLTAGTGGTTTWSAPSIAGLTQIVPTSITKGASGSASVSADGAVTFSGTESISLNSCFTSTYEHYQITFTGDSSTSANDLRLRLRASGSDLTTSYDYTTIERSNSGFGTTGGSSTAMYFATIGADKTDVIATIFSPQVSGKIKTILSNGFYASLGVSFGNTMFASSIYSTSSYDGFTIYPTSGTITGTIRVYGYKNG